MYLGMSPYRLNKGMDYYTQKMFHTGTVHRGQKKGEYSEVVVLFSSSSNEQ